METSRTHHGTWLALGLLAVLVLVFALCERGVDQPPPDPPSNEVPAPAQPANAPIANANAGSEAVASAPVPAVTVERTEAATGTGAPFIRVRVVDPDEQPIAGAVVESFAPDAGTVAADEAGWCTLRVRAEGREAVRLRVTAGDRHRQAMWQRLPELTIRLPFAGPLRGRVVDETTGAPIAGAEITMPHNYCKLCEPEQKRSAADGTFTLAAVQRGENCTIVVRARGFPHQAFSQQFPGRGEPIEHTFRVRRGVEITGRCIDLATRVPLAGVAVTSSGWDLGTTGAGGEFSVLMLPDGNKVQLRFTLQRYCSATSEVPSPQNAPFEQPMVLASSITGTVRDPRGAPIAGVRVTAVRNDEAKAPVGLPENCRIEETDYNRRVTTEAEGRFQLGGLVPGANYRVRPHHPDYNPPQGEARFGIVTIASDDAPPVALVLESKPELGPVGTLVGTYRCNGAPGAGRIEWQGTSRGDSAAIESNGTFRIENVQAGKVVVTAIAHGFEYADGALRDALQVRRELELTAGQELRIDLEQQVARATVRGRLTYPDGSAAVARHVYSRAGMLRFHTRADADGRYELEVPAALSELYVDTDGETAQRRVAPGAQNVDFVVQRRGTLRYRVAAAGGPSARCWLRRDGGEFRPIRALQSADAEGFLTEPQSHGNYTLVAAAADLPPLVHAFVQGDQATVDLTLAAGVKVTFRLDGESETPPKGLGAELVDECLAAVGIERQLDGFPSDRRVDLAKGGTLRGIGPGRHRLVATAAEFEIVPDTIVVGASDTTVALRWRPRAR